MNNKTVFIAMSGGVDSTAAALLLLNLGYTVKGLTMRLFDGEAAQNTVFAAQTAAARMGISLEVADLRGEFAREVITPFIDGYMTGITPNPCVFCNRRIKFGALLDYVHMNGGDFLATGHYARIAADETGVVRIRRAAHANKDQSYVLYTITREALPQLLFPLGSLTKAEARSIAAQVMLGAKEAEESQDICFIPGGDYAGFIEKRIGKSLEPGDFIDQNGKILGRHDGLARYTAGQRRGFGIAAAERLYALEKNAVRNTVTLGPKEGLFKSTVILSQVNFHVDIVSGVRLMAMVRYRGSETPARVYPLDDSRARVEFETPVTAPVAGQSAVFYDGDYLVGGGIIESAGD